MGLLTRSYRPELEDPVRYPPVKSSDIKFVEIFPPIGVARLGDSTKEYFLGPELPIDNDERANIIPTEDNRFRDDEGNIRRQAVRFRVYAYDANYKLLGEVNVHNGYTLEWRVDVANMKAAGNNIRAPLDKKRNPDIQGDKEPRYRFELIAQCRETIVHTDGNDVKQLDFKFRGAFLHNLTVNLGQLQVDNAGRLIFIGAKGNVYGKVPTSSDPLDNNNCVDDVCDGRVDVIVKHRDDKNFRDIYAHHNAAVLTGPPKYSWDLRATTTLFDVIENVYQGGADIKTPEFNLHIWPVLEAAALMSWVDTGANTGHRPDTKKDGDFLYHREDLESKDKGKAYKGKVFGKLKNPNGGGGTMPKLKGTNTLTPLQYGRFGLWKEHNFNVTSLKRVAQLEKMELVEQPKCLTRANLEMTIGASFTPGIEACDKVKDPNIYDVTITPTELDPPYRLNPSKINPGELTVGLALPWQSDFSGCAEGWWPAVRPNDVKIDTDPSSARVKWDRGAEGGKMLEFWHLLGFIKRPLITANTRVEDERNLAEVAKEAGA